MYTRILLPECRVKLQHSFTTPCTQKPKLCPNLQPRNNFWSPFTTSMALSKCWVPLFCVCPCHYVFLFLHLTSHGTKILGLHFTKSLATSSRSLSSVSSRVWSSPVLVSNAFNRPDCWSITETQDLCIVAVLRGRPSGNIYSGPPVYGGTKDKMITTRLTAVRARSQFWSKNLMFGFLGSPYIILMTQTMDSRWTLAHLHLAKSLAASTVSSMPAWERRVSRTGTPTKYPTSAETHLVKSQRGKNQMGMCFIKACFLCSAS